MYAATGALQGGKHGAYYHFRKGSRLPRGERLGKYKYREEPLTIPTPAPNYSRTRIMQKQTDILQAAISLFQKLRQERSEHQARVAAIDAVMAQLGGAVPAATLAPVTPAAAPVGRRGRGNNTMRLQDAVAQSLAQGLQTKDELLAGVQRVGYRFATQNPMNSLQTFLYTTGKKLFPRVDGKFSVAGAVAAPKAVKPAKVKRTMSPAARKRISEAVKARWARQKAGKK